MNKNNIQKQLIEQLTLTHNKPIIAYQTIIDRLTTIQEKKTVLKIAEKYNVEV